MIKNDPLPKDKIIQNPFAEENIIILDGGRDGHEDPHTYKRSSDISGKRGNEHSRFPE